jgi:hypothetical protein
MERAPGSSRLNGPSASWDPLKKTEISCHSYKPNQYSSVEGKRNCVCQKSGAAYVQKEILVQVDNNELCKKNLSPS